MATNLIMDNILAAIPLMPSIICFLYIDNGDIKYRIFIAFLISCFAFGLTNSMIPVISQFTLKRGIAGKDLGKKGSPLENVDVPEALGIVPGIVFIICAIFVQLLFAKTDQQLVIYNSGLFSVCFMIFLGFMDDVLDLKWRYKLLLPMTAALPLLSAYSGNTSMYLPKPLTFLLMTDGKMTYLGKLIDIFATVDTEANGSIIELGNYFLVFMGLQSIFCTNAINILAGINGLECGQSFVIASSLLFFKLYEVYSGHHGENELYGICMILPFIGASLGLLRHNWYPAKVFVGDTYCYFAGMTFAVVGIHSHFSKTLLMLFIPQIINFLCSIPQLFKLIPCPRHRLPAIDATTRLMSPSTFPCTAKQYKMFKVKSNDERCPNCTLICAVLRVTGPLTERTLCIVMLSIQAACSIFAFCMRYILLEN